MGYTRICLIFAIPSLITSYFIRRFLASGNEIWITLSILFMAANTSFLTLVLLVMRHYLDDRPIRRQKAWLYRAGYSDYVYKPLDKSDLKSIRLIELLPWSEDYAVNNIDVRIKMHTTTLEGPKAPEYEAISYCWGDATYREPIVCDGAVIQVTNSLHLALRRLQRKDQSRWLWADALCINQADTEEKNWQVRLMGEVYRHATRVLAYLGEAAASTEVLEDFVPRLARAREKMAIELENSDVSEHRLLSYERQKELDIPVMNVWNNRPFIALQSLLSRPWFSRVWIIQEIVLAKDVTVLCGDWEIPWDVLLSAFKVCEVLPESGYNLISFGVDRLSRLQWSRVHNSDHRLEEWLLLHRGAGATDPRDQIYGLLGIASDGKEFDIDYGNPVAETYLHAAKKMLLSSQNLKLLHFIIAPQGGKDPLLPSWVPDWRVELCHMPLVRQGLEFKQVQISFSEDGRKLMARGIQVDTIDMIGECFPGIPYDRYMPWIELLFFSTLSSWLDTFQPFFRRAYVAVDVISSDAFWDVVLEPTSSRDRRVVRFLKPMLDVARRVTSLPIPLDAMDRQIWAVVFLWIPFLFFFKWFVRAMTGEHFVPVRSSFDLLGRRMMTTGNGYLGLAPKMTEEGDVIVMIDGCQTPMVLRPAPEEKDEYEVIGECFLYRYEANLEVDSSNYRSLALV